MWDAEVGDLRWSLQRRWRRGEGRHRLFLRCSNIQGVGGSPSHCGGGGKPTHPPSQEGGGGSGLKKPAREKEAHNVLFIFFRVNSIMHQMELPKFSGGGLTWKPVSSFPHILWDLMAAFFPLPPEAGRASLTRGQRSKAGVGWRTVPLLDVVDPLFNQSAVVWDLFTLSTLWPDLFSPTDKDFPRRLTPSTCAHGHWLWGCEQACRAPYSHCGATHPWGWRDCCLTWWGIIVPDYCQPDQKDPSCVEKGGKSMEIDNAARFR